MRSAPGAPPARRGRRGHGRVHRPPHQSRLDARQRARLCAPRRGSGAWKPPSCISTSTPGRSTRTGARTAASRRPPQSCSASGCSTPSANGEPLRPRRRRHRRQRPRHAADDRGVLSATPRFRSATPASTARASKPRCARTWASPTSSGSAGGVVGDDTHGHVDDICRFVNAEDARADSRGGIRKTQLPAARGELGARAGFPPGRRLASPKWWRCPCPRRSTSTASACPASYANFYISNAAVLVPTFNDPNDRVALGILGELFRDRPVVGIHAVDLVLGFGTLHCLTQQQPAE